MNLSHIRLSATLSPPDGERGALSEAARRRLLSRRGEPLLLADWERVLMIHFAVDADELHRDVPFELDTRDGRAFVSLVAFTMEKMRPRIGGRFSAWLFHPIATHDFLNLRTYVRQGDEAGIHFLAEWLSNRLATRLGPATFSLPYRLGRIEYEHMWECGDLRGRVDDVATGASFTYDGCLDQSDLLRPGTGRAPVFGPCESGSLDEWLMERYTAFNCARGRKQFFRIWHPPWMQSPIEIMIQNDNLITSTWPWFKHAQLVGANFSPGLIGVWMGRPQRLIDAAANRRRGTLSTFFDMP